MNTHNPVISSKKSSRSNILCIKFNQDQGCFAVSHEHGFLVYNTNPFELRVNRSFENSSSSGSGIGHIAMLHRTNYLALVGGGKTPKYPSNRLVVWDDLKRKNSLSIDFLNPILNVLFSRMRIIVVLKNHVAVYGFSSPPKKYAIYETIDNEHGIADLSTSYPHTASGAYSGASLSLSQSFSSSSRTEKYQILAFPGRSVGQIQLVDISPAGQEKNLVSIIKAHKSKIRCLTLNRSGTMIASASETGTIIRVHSTHNTALLWEFRRGLDRAIITSMEFSHNDSKLAVLSDKNTLHIYDLSFVNEIQNASTDFSNFQKSHPYNRHHVLGTLPLPIPVPNYFKSVWSFCSINTNKFHTDNSEVDSSVNDVGVIGWASNDSVIIVWKNKKLWEKYVIVERKANKNPEDPNSSSAWNLVRFSWKRLDGFDE